MAPKSGVIQIFQDARHVVNFIKHSILQKDADDNDPMLFIDATMIAATSSSKSKSHCGTHCDKISYVLKNRAASKIEEVVRRCHEFYECHANYESSATRTKRATVVLLDKTGGNQAVTIAAILMAYFKSCNVSRRIRHVHKAHWPCNGLCSTCNKSDKSGDCFKLLQRAVGALKYGASTSK